MTAVSGQDSNQSSTRYAIETSQGVLPGSPVWKLTEPNTVPRFGPRLTAVSRKFITEDRMSRKGSIVDRKPGAEVPQDFTLENQLDFIEAVMCGALRVKALHTALTTVSGDNTFNAASGLGIFATNNLVLVKGWPGNDGLHLVTSATGTTVVVGSVLVNGAAPAGALMMKVGHQFATADVTTQRRRSPS